MNLHANQVIVIQTYNHFGSLWIVRFCVTIHWCSQKKVSIYMFCDMIKNDHENYNLLTKWHHWVYIHLVSSKDENISMSYFLLQVLYTNHYSIKIISDTFLKHYLKTFATMMQFMGGKDNGYKCRRRNWKDNQSKTEYAWKRNIWEGR